MEKAAGAAGITLFVVGQMRRSDTLWMATAALTVLGGGAFLFLFGVWAKPALDYLRHVERMLYGRKRETVGVLTRFSPELCERDGLWCHAMMVNLGSGEEEDDRLVYYDDEKPAPAVEKAAGAGAAAGEGQAAFSQGRLDRGTPAHDAGVCIRVRTRGVRKHQAQADRSRY